jgi:hypothetical protein
MQEPTNPYSGMNDRKKTPAELHREQTYAERQARIKAQAQKDEEAAERIKAKRLAFRESMVERIAQARANQERARADFDALGEEMAKATNRKERIELGRQLKAIAPNTGVSYVPEKHCKNCFVGISKAINPQCLDCKGFICINCECCFCEPDKDYDNVCWNCHLEVSKETSKFCSACGWYVCSNCGSCYRDCNGAYNPLYVQTGDPFLPDYPDDIS